MGQDDSKYHHGALRAAIERIAWDKVAAEGVEKLSLRACARAAEVDPAAVYRHFKSKDDILKALSRRAFSELADRLEGREQAAQTESPKRALLDIGLGYIEHATENPKLFEMVFDLARRVPISEIEGTSKTGRGAYQVLREALRRWQPALDEGQVDVMSFTLWSTVHGLSGLSNSGLGPQGQADQRRRWEQVCLLVLDGCEVRGA